MLRKLIKNKRAQNTAEYAILISLVVAGIIAMQTYAQRALQARIHDAAVYMANTAGGNQLGKTLQYEPYYLNTNYEVTRDENQLELLGNDLTRKETTSFRQRNGEQSSSYTSVVGNEYFVK